MDAFELHNMALQASDKNVEVVFAEELDQIIAAARAGKFSIILNNNNFTNDFTSYLRRANFKVMWYRDDTNYWSEYYESSSIPWAICSKLCIKW